MPITSMPQLRYRFDSAFVENCGPSMHRYVPPCFTLMRDPRHAASTTRAISAQTGSANAMCATTPSPKKVDARFVVRSKNCSGITKSSGLCSSFSDPTADSEMIRLTPSFLNPQMLARKFSSLGKRRCPRPCRARNATFRPSSEPTTYASDGSPHGVCCFSSCVSVSPGMLYSPLPPMIPISASANASPECSAVISPNFGLYKTQIHRGDIWTRRHGESILIAPCLRCGERELFGFVRRQHGFSQLVRALPIQTLHRQHQVPVLLDRHAPFIGHPFHRCLILANAAGNARKSNRHILRDIQMLRDLYRDGIFVPRLHRLRINFRELRRIFRRRPSRHIHHAQRTF